MKVRLGPRSFRVNNSIPVVPGMLIMVAFTAYHTWRIVPFFYLGLSGMAICLLLMPVKKLLQFVFLLAPNIMAIKLSQNSSALFGYYFILVFAKYVFVFSKIRLRIPFLLFLTSISITAFTYSESSLIFMAIRCFFFFVAIYTIFSENWSQDLKYRESLIRSYLCGIALCVVCGFAYYLLASKNIFSGHFSGINNGRNFFSSLLSCGIATTLMYNFYSSRVNPFYIISIILMLTAGILSNSRTFFVSLCFILILFVSMLSKRRMRGKVIQVVLLLCAAVLVFGDSILPSLQNLLNRFAQDDVSGGNGRVVAWSYYISKTFSSPWRILFGNGLAQKYISRGEIDVVEHSSIVELLSVSGLVGTAVTLLCYFYLIHAVVGLNKKFAFSDWVPLGCAMLCYLMLSAMFSDILNFSLLISLLAADYSYQMRTKGLNH